MDEELEPIDNIEEVYAGPSDRRWTSGGPVRVVNRTSDEIRKDDLAAPSTAFTVKPMLPLANEHPAGVHKSLARGAHRIRMVLANRAD